MKIRIFVSALLLAFSASAQTPLPARQVSVITNGAVAWSSIAPTGLVAQAALDWIDANWMAIDASSWSNFPTALDTAQGTFDWLDEAWGIGVSMIHTNWSYLLHDVQTSPPVYAQWVFDWVDDNYGIPTAGWTALEPTNRFGVANETSLRDFANWIDDNWVHAASEITIVTNSMTNSTLLATMAGYGTNTVQALAQGADAWLGYLLDTSLPANYVKGTNLFAFDYDAANKEWAQFRVGFSAQSAISNSFVIPFNSKYYTYSWMYPTNYLTERTFFTANGNLSGGAFSTNSSTYSAPYNGAYFVSVGATFVCTNLSAAGGTNFPVGIGVYQSGGGGPGDGVHFGQTADMSAGSPLDPATNSVIVKLTLGRVVHLTTNSTLSPRYYVGAEANLAVNLSSMQFDALYLAR